jgi:hypothetical protein
MGRSVRAALDEARRVGVMKRTESADELWPEWYDAVPDDVPGVWGAATVRAEAYVLRLSMIYALSAVYGAAPP